MRKFLNREKRPDSQNPFQKILVSFKEMRVRFEGKKLAPINGCPGKTSPRIGELIRSMEALSQGVSKMIEGTLLLADQSFLLSLKESMPTEGIGNEAHRHKMSALTHHIKCLSEHADQVTQETQQVAAGIEKKMAEVFVALKKEREGGCFEVDQVASLLKDIHFGMIYLKKDFNKMVEKTICTETIAEEVLQILKETAPQAVCHRK